jgi:hypothetical protein
MDGIPIRCISMLSNDLVEALSGMFHLATMFAHYPKEMEHMAVKLLSKKDGTFRPIILFRSLFRLHGRLLASRTREWERNHLADQPFGNNQGREALDSVYRACIRQAIGLAGGIVSEAADVLIDLRKCFEHLSRDLLWEACARHGYPMHVARLSITSYGWTRFLLGRYDLCGREVNASRGIAAGSPFATTELKVYLLTLAQAIKATHGPGLTLSIYVDDFSLAVRGKSSAEVVELAVEAYRHTVKGLGQLELDIAGDKTEVIASSHDTREAIVATIPAANHINRCRKLGVDTCFTPGTTRKSKTGQKSGYQWKQEVRAARNKVFKTRFAKCRRMLDGASYRKVMRAGLVTAALYGTEMAPIDDRQLQDHARCSRQGRRGMDGRGP